MSVLLVLFLIFSVGCNNTIRYGGEDYKGNTAKDTINQYYSIFKEQGMQVAHSLSVPDKVENVAFPDISLVEVSHCEIVEKSKLKDSDLNHFPEDVYAVCYVQTSDTVLCNSDCAEGKAGEQVSRNYQYSLVMQSKDSTWQIWDMGYPPFYIP